MNQVLQSMRTGEIYLADVPIPAVQKGYVLVRTAASLISAGTERTSIVSGSKNLLQKAQERPELVRKVIEKARTEGIFSTIAEVRNKLDTGTALGYSAAGSVIASGEDVLEFSSGERVACAGVGYASHAEVISVPKNLCVRLPEKLEYEEGAFGTVGAIALQGLRLAAPTLGESVVVIGLGLLGQITVQLLRANGCRVFGVDLDETKLELAKNLGAEICSTPDEARKSVKNWSRGRGADAVLITAGTSSNDPIELAGEISRLKGRVVVVGAVGLNVPRAAYFERELALQISMSYGPGRYDAEYEERGHDYPFAYVRWTEGRNIEAFLDTVAAGGVNLKKLITHRFPVEQAADAYKLISGETKEPYLGVVLQYDAQKELTTKIKLAASSAKTSADIRVGMIGAGGYAQGFLLPLLKSNGVKFQSITTASGLTSSRIGKQYDFDSCVSNAEEVISDTNSNLIVVATRHDTHAEFAEKALRENKNVFVEKPLAINDEQLDSVLEAAKSSIGKLMVGYNRRFSPSAKTAKEFFADRQSPLSILYRINAGRISRKSWVQDPQQGGRIIGEVCHFIDLMHYLTDSLTTRVFAESIAGNNHEMINEDSVFITLKFADGSNGTIAYLAEGDKTMPKERVEIYGESKIFVIDDFQRISMFKNGRETSKKLGKTDKGQTEEISVACSVVSQNSDLPISLADLAATTRATFRIVESLRTATAFDI